MFGYVCACLVSVFIIISLLIQLYYKHNKGDITKFELIGIHIVNAAIIVIVLTFYDMGQRHGRLSVMVEQIPTNLEYQDISLDEIDNYNDMIIEKINIDYASVGEKMKVAAAADAERWLD